MKLDAKNLERIIARRSPESHAHLVESARLMLERHIWNNVLFGLTLEQQIALIKSENQKIINLELPVLLYCYIRLLEIEQQRRKREHLQKMFAERGTLSRRLEDRSQEELLTARIQSVHDGSSSSRSGRYSARGGGNPNPILLPFVQMGLGPQLAAMAHLVPANPSSYALSGAYPLKYAFRPKTPRFRFRPAESPRIRSCRVSLDSLPVLEGPFYQPTSIDLPAGYLPHDEQSAVSHFESAQNSRATSASVRTVSTFLTEPGAPIPRPGPDLFRAVTVPDLFPTTTSNLQIHSRKSSGNLSSRSRYASYKNSRGPPAEYERSPVSGRLLAMERPVTPRWEQEMRSLLKRIYKGPSQAQLDQVELRSMRPTIRLLARNYCLSVYRNGLQTDFSLPLK